MNPFVFAQRKVVFKLQIIVNNHFKRPQLANNNILQHDVKKIFATGSLCFFFLFKDISSAFVTTGLLISRSRALFMQKKKYLYILYLRTVTSNGNLIFVVTNGNHLPLTFLLFRWSGDVRTRTREKLRAALRNLAVVPRSSRSPERDQDISRIIVHIKIILNNSLFA